MRHVHTDLVRATGLQPYLHQGVRGKTFQYPVMADRRLARFNHRHAQAVLRVPADGRINRPSGRQDAVYQRQVFAADGMFLQLRNQRGVRLKRTRHHHQATGVLIQAVNDTGAWHAGQTRVKIEQTVLQGAITIAGRRVYHQAGRFVDDPHLRILIDNIQGHRLGLDSALVLQLGADFDSLATQHPLPYGHRLPLQQDLTPLCPLLQTTAGILREKLGQHLVETPSGRLLRDTIIEINGFRHGIRWPTAVLRPYNWVRFSKPEKWQMHWLRLIPLLAVLFTLGCATTADDESSKLSANDLYKKAKEAMASADFETAIDTFEKLEARFPFGKYAQQAQLEIAYAYYKFDEPDSAITAADRFISNNPGNPHLDYAYYLKGLVNYTRGMSIVDRVAQREPSERDTRALRDAFSDFTTLVQKFPDSRYAEDSKERLIFLHNQLADYEIKVARYYMHRKAWVAAANRARYVIENYQRTPAAREALQVLVVAYTRMGLKELANDARRVLERNTP